MPVRFLLAALAAGAGLLATACSGPGLHALPADGGLPVADAAEEPIDPGALPAPAQGQGVQMKIDAFTVLPGSEIQNCYFFHVPDLPHQPALPPGPTLTPH